ncbi:uncharacterized protein LOC107869068 [Capsicum annuum]|uniref:uncharacterized protein LOC107869068 n=1 Tax=Capsicum annuum TaxID=4072 RepID=UPI0007BFBE95|nr:uncharacterized protein LOC107869068 [Capsicum annuum]
MTVDPPSKPLFSETVKKNFSLSPNPSSQSDPSPLEGEDLSSPIIFIAEAKQRTYSQWKFSVIVKLLGKKLHHQYFKKKLIELWKLKEVFPLIDISQSNLKNKNHRRGSCRRGLGLSLETTSQVAHSLGRLLKVDACTSSTLRACYARLCVQVPLDTPVKSSVLIDSHAQSIHYEGESFLCKHCDCLGHTVKNCPKAIPNSSDSLLEVNIKTSPNGEEWTTVNFNHRKKNRQSFGTRR